MLLDVRNDSSKHAHHQPMRAIGGGAGETRELSCFVCAPSPTGLYEMRQSFLYWRGRSSRCKSSLYYKNGEAAADPVCSPLRTLVAKRHGVTYPYLPLNPSSRSSSPSRHHPSSPTYPADPRLLRDRRLIPFLRSLVYTAPPPNQRVAETRIRPATRGRPACAES